MPSSRAVSESARRRLRLSSASSLACAKASSECITGQRKRQMASNASENSAVPDWYADGLAHVWLPYTPMRSAAPLAVARTDGTRIVLADGRELIDGIASWWTACHGYNPPHIRQAVERQLNINSHVLFAGLVHEQALTLALRLAGFLPGDLDHVFFSES